MPEIPRSLEKEEFIADELFPDEEDEDAPHVALRFTQIVVGMDAGVPQVVHVPT